MIKMTDLDLAGKRVLIRADLNVPIKEGKITYAARILSLIPTIEIALQSGAFIMLASHLGRPSEGKCDEVFSLLPVVHYLQENFSFPVHLVKDYLDGVDVIVGEVIVLENVRFNLGEERNDEALSRKYANLCDIYVMDAFGVAHRTQASTYGVAKFAPIACAGPLLSTELESLAKVLDNPAHPMVAIVGGAKISSKITVLETLLNIADQLIVGGGIANTFIAAQGHNVGKSLHEVNMLPAAKKLLKNYDIYLPTDVRVSTEFSENAPAVMKTITNVKDKEQILDFGDVSTKYLISIIKNAKTILWNGPLGVFEFSNFRKGTEMLTKAIADSQAFSIVGGGDTLAAINLFGMTNKISYISAGGGAFLEFIERKTLPVVTILKERAL